MRLQAQPINVVNILGTDYSLKAVSCSGLAEPGQEELGGCLQ